MAEKPAPVFPHESKHYKDALAMAKTAKEKAELFEEVLDSLRNLYDICLMASDLQEQESKQVELAGEVIEKGLKLMKTAKEG